MVLKNMVVGTILAGVFMTAMIMFGANLALDNNSNQTILNDERLIRLNSSLTGSLSLFHGKVISQQTGTFNQTVKEKEQGFFLNFLPAIITFLSMPLVIWNVLASGAQEILGIPGFLLNLVGAVILITIIFLGWKVFKTGN